MSLNSRHGRRVRIGLIAMLCLFSFNVQTSSADKPSASIEKNHRHTNRLAKETSPYLLLHAHNPVNWHPWDAEALATARKENKLIFLSIGYSSCHWCHVMERESFMNEEIAKYLNQHFVCIKVDREERPDIDEIYMTALQVYFQLIGAGGSGGWPLSMFLTPEGKPVGGGTYFPPVERNGQMGFLDVCTRIQGIWEKSPDKVKASGEQLTAIVRDSLKRRPTAIAAPLEPKLLDDLQEELSGQYDAKHGGFGFSEENPARPKFPESSNLFFLLSRAKDNRNTDRDKAQSMLLGTLENMARGGIRDHVGGGFHRYTVDRFWRVPHFEKMLYDNAQLASVYARAFELTGDEQYRRVAEELAAFVFREMTHPLGGFYSALDAESEDEEGRFYVWETAELKAALSQSEFDLLAAVYGLAGDPNFEGRHILLINRSLEEIAKEQGLTPTELEEKLEPIRAKLLEVRGKRERPLLDTKILAGWNGLMIRGLADAGRIFKRQDYLDAATRAAEFVLKNLRNEEGRLQRTFTADEAKHNAYLDDYAFLADGLIALHQATDDVHWLNRAAELTDTQIDLFWDQDAGGFFFTSKDHEELIARSRGPVDQAVPSGNSLAAANLLYLGRALERPAYLKKADQTVNSYAAVFNRFATALPRMAITAGQLMKEKKPEASK